MKYVINTTQRVYYSEKEITIMLCRILSIIIKKDSKNISLVYNDEKIYTETFDDKTFELLKNSKHFLTLMEYIIPLKKYSKEILNILKKNEQYLNVVFKNCL